MHQNRLAGRSLYDSYNIFFESAAVYAAVLVAVAAADLSVLYNHGQNLLLI
jgi:hypothetical protein